ncbi:lipoprotein [Clostridium malenominatum]|uniref:Lipoprotein n=1 Tax=Clostridium malenominatum TaxID=1539 RepID=A0ABN1IY93_9CLOT
MELVFKLSSFIMAIILTMTLSACSKTQENSPEKNIHLSNLEFNDVMILENKDIKTNIFKLNNNSIKKIDNLEYVSEIVYKKEVSIYSLLVHDANEIKRNSINILKDDKVSDVKGFYYAKDLRLSPKGSLLSYRSYSTQSLDSAEGLSLYNVNKSEKIQLNSKVLVSGNLYQWINEEEILYYGAHEEDKTAGIFKYNVKNSEEELYVNSIKGYYTYFLPCGDNLIILSRDENNNMLYFYDKENDKSIEISDAIEEIYDGSYDSLNNIMYFIGLGKNNEVPELYSLDIGKNKLERITFDFPLEVDPYGGLKIDNEGAVYYCGYTEIQGVNNDVFKYVPKENSNTLISINSSKYKIIGTN